MLILRRKEANRGLKRARFQEQSEAIIAYQQGRVAEIDDCFQIARALYHIDRGGANEVRQEARRVIAITEKRGEFVTFEDGFVYLWPAQSPHGAMTSWHLRTLADEMDRRNRAWDLQLSKAQL
jgi:hypothetical protein